MISKHPTSSPTKPAGFALPMTIIAVAGLTLLLVGLLSVLTLERKTARSYSDSSRADFAVESGLATAVAALTDIALRDDSIVFRLDDPAEPTVPADDRPSGFREQFFTYGAIHDGTRWNTTPLFSGAPAMQAGERLIDTSTLIEGLSAYTQDAMMIGGLTEHDQSVPRAKWVEVPAGGAGDYSFRYAYWIEDLAGRIDGVNAGSEAREMGRSAAELPLFSLFDEVPNPSATTLISNRQNLRTPGSVRTLLDVEQAKLAEPYIHYNSVNLTRPQAKLVPHGFGYKDQGKPARDLNEFVAGGNVEELATYIDENLPGFTNRRGGFRDDHDYVKTIAASIIDYADSDSNPSAGSDYRGIDSYPFVNKIYDRYEWLNPQPNAPNVQIRMETYVEFWNPSNQPTSGQARFQIINPVKAKIATIGDLPFNPANPTYTIGQLSLQPNEHRVVLVGGRTYTFPKGNFGSANVELTSSNETRDISDSNYIVQWRDSGAVPFQIIDTALGGSQRQFNTLTPNPNSRVKWKGAGSPNLNTAVSQYGDPRASMYIAEFHYANTYTSNAAWGGSVLKTTGPAGARNGYVSNWIDRGTNSPRGIPAGSEDRRPGPTGIVNATGGVTSSYPPNQPNRAPTVISNAGRYFSLGELGHIFDPAQWSNVSEPNSSPNSRAGGGISLAVGRPEFHAFDQEGRRAAQLLDLFSIEPDSSVPLARPININTASPAVLRALMADVVLNDDQMNPGIKPPQVSRIGDVFANYVTSHRNVFPLRGQSDLNLLRPLGEMSGTRRVQRDHSSPADETFFGSINTYPDASKPSDNFEGADYLSPVWSDAGREELFRKTLDLVTFTSKTFRIVVAGEVLDPAGKPIARATREYHYSIEPQRNPDTGEILTDADGKPSNIRIIKHYEKSL